LAQADYVAVLARTPAGLIPVVRQFRPAVEAYTWELPGGLVDGGEDPRAACERELLEETGLRTRKVTFLGTQYADTGRLENRQHAFYMQTSDPDPDFAPEDGVGVEFISFEDLKSRMKDGLFLHPLHMAVVMLYELHGG
jgi:8-oxo-dGTP pyrophosphatase MutT (NUDIX family)